MREHRYQQKRKIVVAKTDITDLYHMFENLSLTDKQVEEITGADVTSFRFNLSDGTTTNWFMSAMESRMES